MGYTGASITDLHQLAAERHADYQAASPFPHIRLDNLFNPDSLDAVLQEFPDLDTDGIQYRDRNQVKRASRGEYRFGEATLGLFHFLNSQPFLEFLTTLTGIEALLPDPYFAGAGVHEIRTGGYLNVHADFNKHKLTQLDRRLNVLIYLNKDWDESFGGHLELWDKDMQGCVERVLPVFNRTVVFTTTDFSYHGHPEPLTCPPERARRSMALYYYTNGRPASEVNTGLEVHSTLFRQLPATTSFEKMGRWLSSAAEEVTPPVITKLAGVLRRQARRALR